MLTSLRLNKISRCTSLFNKIDESMCSCKILDGLIKINSQSSYFKLNTIESPAVILYLCRFGTYAPAVLFSSADIPVECFLSLVCRMHLCETDVSLSIYPECRMEQLPWSFCLSFRLKNCKLNEFPPSRTNAGSPLNAEVGAGVKSRTTVPSHSEGLCDSLQSSVHSHQHNHDR